MAMVPTLLQTQLYNLNMKYFNNSDQYKPENGWTPERITQEWCREFSEIMTNYIKTATVTSVVTGACSTGPVSGTATSTSIT